MLRILLIALAAIWGISILALIVGLIGARFSRRIRRLLDGE